MSLIDDLTVVIKDNFNITAIIPNYLKVEDTSNIWRINVDKIIMPKAIQRDEKLAAEPVELIEKKKIDSLW